MQARTNTSLKLLLVDNNLHIYEMLKKTVADIKGKNFIVDRISDYQEALQEIKKNKHDVVFVDYQLDSQRTGLDLMEEINVTDSKMPFIILTGQEPLTVGSKALELGAADVLTQEQLTTAFINHSIQYSIERQRLINQINRLAHYDALTDLPNRLSFTTALKRYVASAVRYDRKSALLLCDIDGFKTINENYNHDMGDLLLQEISQRLKSIIRDSDFLARIDSNKFAIILNEIANPHQAGITAQKICQTINQPFHIHHTDISITMSIGIVCFPSAKKNEMNLVDCATMALNRIKKQFRNGYQFYRHELHEQHERQLLIEELLPHCLTNNELYLTYQPIYNIQKNVIIGMEGLIRWHCKKLNQDVPLDIFIPLAEENGLIHEIGRWVITTAVTQLKTWQKYGFQGYITLNTSPQQLSDPTFIDHLHKQTRLLPDCSQLKLEIKEEALANYTLEANDRIEKIHELGLEIYIDHFGSGYSSFKQLFCLPISTLKIDRSIIAVIGDSEMHPIFKAAMALAKSLDLELIAEGIETDHQRKILIDLGCIYGQGYFYSKPLLTRQMTQYLKSHQLIRNSDF